MTCACLLGCYDVIGVLLCDYQVFSLFNRFLINYDLMRKVLDMLLDLGKKDGFRCWFHYFVLGQLQELWAKGARGEGVLEKHLGYYPDGKLRRREIRPLDLFLQGMDYAYTLDGWLKAINAEVLGHDPGGDGFIVGHDTSYYARDVFSLLLRYYPNDYRPIKPGVPSLEASVNSGSQYLFKPYYTGWISSWSLHLDTLHTAYSFRYDQMGRLTRARTLLGFTGTQWDAVLVDRHSTSYKYDLVGNILELVRYDGSGDLLDSLVYNYYDLSLNNRLKSIFDVVSTQFPHDLESQPSVNYLYDPVGNMVRDVSRNLSVRYNYSNRPKLLTLGNNTIRMLYNPAGYRFFKGTDERGEVFIYNTQGQLMAKYSLIGDTLKLEFLPIYEGTRRLGIYEPEGVEWVVGSGKLSLLPNIYVLPCLNCPMQLRRVRRYALKPTRKYELTDHLGNVRVVIADQRMAVADSSGQVVAYYKPKVVGIYDYYPYGWVKIRTAAYSFGANGGSLVEGWDSSGGTYYTLFRLLDTRLGRWWQVEPRCYGYAMISSYVINNSMSPTLSVDPTGLDAILVVYPEYRVDPDIEVPGSGEIPRLPLGHVGLLLIDEKTGLTRYYEFGRYGTPRGRIRNVRIPNVQIDPATGLPTLESLHNVFQALSFKTKQSGPIVGVYIRGVDFHKADALIQRMMRDSNLLRRYSILRYNCGLFAHDMIQRCSSWDQDSISMLMHLFDTYSSVTKFMPRRLLDAYISAFRNEIRYDPGLRRTVWWDYLFVYRSYVFLGLPIPLSLIKVVDEKRVYYEGSGRGGGVGRGSKGGIHEPKFR